MVNKLSRQQKAANTRKKNLLAAKINLELMDKATGKWKVSNTSEPQTLRINLPKDYVVKDGPAVISLSKALDNSLDRLEQRMTDYIARVDGILA